MARPKPVVRADDASLPLEPAAGAQIDPYLDYGRYFTAQGGILLVYKDLDLRFRHSLWRVFAWSLFSGLEAWFLLAHSPVQNDAINIACLVVVAFINFLIVSKPVEIPRQIEIRPDCMIIGGEEVFWQRFMEAGPPRFQPSVGGNQTLCGVYGTRYVEFLTIRRADEFDRMPEVLAAHLQDAMEQLWNRPP